MSKIEDVGVEALTELALNMRWSWNRSTDELWSELDPELWALTTTHGPCSRRSRPTGGTSGRVIGMQTFGASAPLKELQKKFGFQPDRVVAAAREQLA